MTSSGTELAPLAVQCALQSHCWWLYLTSSVKPCNRVSNALLNRENQGKNSCAQVFVHTPLASHHTPIHSRWLPRHCMLSKHLREKSISFPHCLCVFSFSNIHIRKLKEGRNVWHFCSDYLAEAPLHFLATPPGS